MMTFCLRRIFLKEKNATREKSLVLAQLKHLKFKHFCLTRGRVLLQDTVDSRYKATVPGYKATTGYKATHCLVPTKLFNVKVYGYKATTDIRPPFFRSLRVAL